MATTQQQFLVWKFDLSKLAYQKLEGARIGAITHSFLPADSARSTALGRKGRKRW
jgi:hypothetical protein